MTTWRRADDITVVAESVASRLERHWEDGWNRNDAEVIMGPFAQDIVFSSPFVSRLTGDRSKSTIEGRDAVRQYVVDSFVRATPGIQYTLEATYSGTDSVVLVYTVHHPDGTDRSGADTMLLGADGRVVEWRCHYPFDD